MDIADSYDEWEPGLRFGLPAEQIEPHFLKNYFSAHV